MQKDYAKNESYGQDKKLNVGEVLKQEIDARMVGPSILKWFVQMEMLDDGSHLKDKLPGSINELVE